ncbi:MAG TPA: aminotransferase class V-fold PLP-dependent enzyme [Pyrinomonadaceae bacterium]|nr:aminotransferase class V-fold PLP-dependent enzyme [Pyrinomonadaceae bacterium]
MIDDFVEQHRLLGKTVPRIVEEFVEALGSRRVTPEAAPADLEKLFDEPLPEKGIAIEEILERFRRDVAPNAMGVPSPRYFGQFNPTPLPIGVWADVLSSMLNQNAGAWRNGPTSAMIEARVIRWLCDLLAYGPNSFGTLASGGSEANLIALKCARDSVSATIKEHGLTSFKNDLIVYASEQCHYSIDKSVDLLGLGRSSLRKIPTDERFHMRLDVLREQIARDTDNALYPFCIVGVAGTTSTGVIDPLEDLAVIAREEKLWYHIDAAYGAPLAFSTKHSYKLHGIELADSITFDPHKWMFVPFSCGAVLVREGGRVLRNAFDMSPEYLNEDRGGADVEFDFFRYGQMGTRRFNSLKLWMALKFMGREGYARTVERQIELTKYFAKRIDELPDFECIGEVETAVCCFRHRSNEDHVQQRIQQIIERSGEAWLSTTVVHGQRALRVNINSFLTEQHHVDHLVTQIENAGSVV